MSFNMKKIAILLFLATFFSCSNGVSYISEKQNSNLGVDFTKGTWLLNKIDCPNNVLNDLTGLANTRFGAHLKDRMYSTSSLNNDLISTKIEFNPSKKELQELKKLTVFDFIINIKAENLKENLPKIDITNHKYKNKSSNRGSVEVEIYDLNALEISYSKKITGIESISESNNSDLNINKSTNEIIIACYKKIMTDLEKKSIK